MSDREPQTVLVRRAKKGNSQVYHTDPECRMVRRMEHVSEWTRRGTLERKRECAFCAGTVDHTPDPQARDHCRSCGATLDSDGECGFCENLEAVLGGADD